MVIHRWNDHGGNTLFWYEKGVLYQDRISATIADPYLETETDAHIKWAKRGRLRLCGDSRNALFRTNRIGGRLPQRLWDAHVGRGGWRYVFGCSQATHSPRAPRIVKGSAGLLHHEMIKILLLCLTHASCTAWASVVYNCDSIGRMLMKSIPNRCQKPE